MIITITEYDRLSEDRMGNKLPIGGRRLGHQGFTANSIGTAFSSETKFIRVAGDTAIHLRVGGNAASTNAYSYVPANTVEFFAVDPSGVPSIISA